MEFSWKVEDFLGLLHRPWRNPQGWDLHLARVLSPYISMRISVNECCGWRREQTLLPRVCDLGGEGGQTCAPMPAGSITTLTQLGSGLPEQHAQ